MWRRTLLILTAALMLPACATGTLATPAMTLPYLGNPDTDCPPLPLATSGDLAELARNHKMSTDQYHQCKAAYQSALQRLKVREPAR